jgi:hypothetical protein
MGRARLWVRLPCPLGTCYMRPDQRTNAVGDQHGDRDGDRRQGGASRMEASAGMPAWCPPPRLCRLTEPSCQVAAVGRYQGEHAICGAAWVRAPTAARGRGGLSWPIEPHRACLRLQRRPSWGHNQAWRIPCIQSPAPVLRCQRLAGLVGWLGPAAGLAAQRGPLHIAVGQGRQQPAEHP